MAKADIPEAFAGLLQPYRYKVFYGGRGSGKSWTFATVLILRAAERSPVPANEIDACGLRLDVGCHKLRK
jgi:hypothetical protein